MVLSESTARFYISDQSARDYDDGADVQEVTFEIDILGRRLLEQITTLRSECKKTADDLRLLDSQLNGIGKRQD